MKKTQGGFWTIRYTLINVLYFVAFCTVHAYAGVYLLDKGFTNTQVGLALAIANILSVFGQPLVAGIVDKGGVLTNRIVVIISSLFPRLCRKVSSLRWRPLPRPVFSNAEVQA